MKTKIILVFLMVILCNYKGYFQSIWNGAPITFTKANFADHTLEANQDRISSNVWITRANSQGIFNIFEEGNYTDFASPTGTEWALGTTSNIGSLTFNDWETTINSEPPNMLNIDMVLHLITDDVYIDIKFLTWTTGDGAGNSGGGGFSYIRSTDQALGIDKYENSKKITIYPNPSSDILFFNNSLLDKNVEVFDLTGKRLLEIKKSSTNSIDIRNLKKGMYFIKIEDFSISKFIKK